MLGRYILITGGSLLLWLLLASVLNALLGSFLPLSEDAVLGLSSLLALPPTVLLFLRWKRKARREHTLDKIRARIYRSVSSGRPAGQIVAEIESMGERYDLTGDEVSSLYNYALSLYLDRTFKSDRIEITQKSEIDTIVEAMERRGMKIDEAALNKLNRFNRLYTLLTRDLQPIECGINLRKGEKCYLHLPSVQMRKWKKKRTRFTSLGVSYRLTRNIRLYTHVGGLSESQDMLETEDVGDVYITSRRLIFVGDKKTQSINFSRILEVEVSNRHFEIKRDRGPVLLFFPVAEYDPLEFSVVLGKVMGTI